MIFGSFLALLPLLIVLKARSGELRLTPDAHIYIALASGEVVPAPYAYRILLPLSARLLTRLSGRPPRETLASLGRVGAVGAVVATYSLTWCLSGSHSRALVSAYAITFADSFFAYSLRTPWLVDTASCALALPAAVVGITGHPLAAAALLCTTALAKEAWALLSWAFMTGIDPSLWWTLLPALGLHLGLRLARKTTPPDPGRAPWLVSPVGWVWEHKRRKWFDFRTNVGGLGPTPWVLAYYVVRSPLKVATVAVVILSWAQAHFATDHDRLLAHMLPFVVPVLSVTAPTEVLTLYLLASCYWPFYRED